MIDFLKSQGYKHLTRLASGEVAGTMNMMFTTGLFVGLTEMFYRTRFCYEDEDDAIAAITLWNGYGDPPGPWVKEKPSDRLNDHWSTRMIAEDQRIKMVGEITKLMTPLSLINGDEVHYKADKILPDKFTGFDSLLKAREEIRHLRVLPVKSNSDRAAYHAISKTTLRREVDEQLGEKSIIFSRNEYPYFLPPDVQQSIIWVKDEVSHQESIRFIADRCINLGIDPGEMIIFERSRLATVPLIKGTFPAVRHIHFWTRKIL